MASERLIGAACTLGTNEMRQRLCAWRDVRERALYIEPIRGGVRLAPGPDQPMRWQRSAARDWRPQWLSGTL